MYLLNRVSTKALQATIPYEAWTGSKPRLDHLRIFGCMAHMKVPAVQTRKLDDRSVPVVYLGVEVGSKAHCLYDPHHSKIHVSHDVVSEEDRSWDWSDDGAKDPVTWVSSTVEEPEEDEPVDMASTAGSPTATATP